MDFTNKQILVIGAGLSGLAACRFLLAKGAKITLSDNKPLAELNQEAQELIAQGIEFLGQEQAPTAFPWQLVIKSPGIPPTNPLVSALSAKGIEIWGEVELAYRLIKAPFIAITGTNGKTTTTSLIGYILEQAGHKVLVAGNIGEPIINHVEEEYDYIVAETSSFQLDNTLSFKPKVAVMMNITPDHLNHHGNMENYVAAKQKILNNQTADDFAVLNIDDQLIKPLAKTASSKLIAFSQEAEVDGAFCDADNLYFKENGQKVHVIAKKDIYIKGSHNHQNALAALAATKSLGLSLEHIAACLKSFLGVEHRQEFVCEIDGVAYINDSKGTNPDAVIKALEAIERPIVLIAGGYDKSADFGPLMAMLKSRARHITVMGQTADKLLAAAAKADITAITRVNDMAEAVATARKYAQKGDAILLSPACAAWGMFTNFEERGRIFKSLI